MWVAEPALVDMIKISPIQSTTGSQYLSGLAMLSLKLIDRGGEIQTLLGSFGGISEVG